jgi:hypothetical protein
VAHLWDVQMSDERQGSGQALALGLGRKRTQARCYEVQVHTHASYEHCDEGDAFRTASYLANMKQPGARQHCWRSALASMP